MDSTSAITLADLQAVPIAAWRGVVQLAGATRSDWRAAASIGLVESKTPPGGRPRMLVSERGTRYLAALRALVDGLASEQSRVLALTEMYKSDGPFRRRYEMPAWAGAWRSGNCFASTALGRAALLLMDVDRG